MSNYKPEPRRGSFADPEKISPAEKIMAELPGTYYRLAEVSKIIGVSPKTLRRLIHSGRTKAPSQQISVGGMKMYLYTPEDIQELKNYYGKVEAREGKAN